MRCRTMSNIVKKQNPIPPWQRIAVDAGTAAHMLSIGRSTFFKRVAADLYPKPGKDGLWRVADLRAIGQQAELTT